MTNEERSRKERLDSIVEEIVQEIRVLLSNATEEEVEEALKFVGCFLKGKK